MSELDARIPVSSELRSTLRELKDDERYEDVIRRLLREHDVTPEGNA